MKDYLSFFLMLGMVTLLPTNAVSGIYKYLDENGRIAYSDKPVNGAKKVKIQRHQPEADDNEDRDSKADDENPSESDEVTQYEALDLLNPVDGKVVSDRAGQVQVILMPTPPLGKHHQLIINVDGKDISKGRHTSLNLSNVYRGSHTVSGKIIDEDGYVMINSPAATFHVRRPLSNEELAYQP